MKEVFIKRVNFRKDHIDSLEHMREELDDHLQSINENTNEVQANFEYIKQIDSRMKLIEKKLSKLFTDDSLDNVSEIELTEKEKDVYMVLEKLSGEKSVEYVEISASVKLSEALVRAYVMNMIEKGVPIRKKYSRGRVKIELDPLFKILQEERNPLHISQKKVKSFA